MKQLIVNADDFGLDVRNDAGVLVAHRQGIVTAASCLVGLDGFDDVIASPRRDPDLDLGLHLNFTWGRRTSDDPLPRLAPGGRLRGKRGFALALLAGWIPEHELLLEARAQAALLRRHVGMPSHVDVHQHFHVVPGVWRAVVRLAREERIRYVRRPAEPSPRGLLPRLISRLFRRRHLPKDLRTTDHFRGLSTTGRLDTATLLGLLAELPEGTTELMAHPGGEAIARMGPDRLADRRARERDALTAPEVRDRLGEEGIALTSFRSL